MKLKTKTRNKKLLLTLLLATAALTLSACGKDKTGIDSTEVPTKAQSAKESVIETRDALEEQQKLSYDADRQEELAELVVPTELDTAEIQATLQDAVSLIANGTPDDAMTKILTDEWYDTLLPGLVIGQRNYEGSLASASEQAETSTDASNQTEASVTTDTTSQAESSDSAETSTTTEDVDATNSYKVMVKSDEFGDRYSAIYYVSGEKATYIEANPDELKYFTADYKDGAYNGAYSIDVLDRETGVVTRDTGTLTNNICTGTLTERVSAAVTVTTAGDSTQGTTDAEATADAANTETALITDINSFWRGRESLAYTEYTGSFSEEGYTTVEQNAEAAANGEIMYATHTDEAGILWFVSVIGGQSDAAENFVFTNETMGLTVIVQ